jgi:ribonuclease HI
MYQQPSTILRALKFIEKIETEDKIATIYTDSRMTLGCLTNSNINTYFIEEIRRKVAEMGEVVWNIQFCWVKAHTRIKGNELASTLAKEAVTNVDIIECYKKVKAHVRIKGNEIASTLAKEAATNVDIIECYKKVPKSVVIS